MFTLDASLIDVLGFISAFYVLFGSFTHLFSDILDWSACSVVLFFIIPVLLACLFLARIMFI
jgi:hypothetical protein